MVIPKRIREELNLSPGDQVRVRVVKGKLILEPVTDRTSIANLHGKYAGENLLAALEEEHQQELRRE
jgi:AbrB family looped-hinge helix DNA binding protein